MQLGEKRIGFLYSPNPNGEKHLANVRKLLAAKGETLALALPLDAKATPEELAKKIFDAKIDVVFNHGSYSTIAAIFKADRKFERQTRFMAVNSGTQQMVKLLGEDARGDVLDRPERVHDRARGVARGLADELHPAGHSARALDADHDAQRPTRAHVAHELLLGALAVLGVQRPGDALHRHVATEAPAEHLSEVIHRR